MQYKYGPCMEISNQNAKTQGTNIINIDTIRGCKNACESCYAKYNTCYSIKNFDIPVKVLEFKGKAKDENVYRIGNFGDPATDWAHTCETVKNLGLKKFFVVTKLQDIKGFDGSLIKNMQVSLDTLNKEHLDITLKNILSISKANPDVSIILRIRSFSSTDKRLNVQQEKAVDFAEKNNLRILETRIRFKRKYESIEKYSLDTKDYEYRGGFLRPKKGKTFLKSNKRHSICDLKELKCAGCSNCKKLFGL